MARAVCKGFRQVQTFILSTLSTVSRSVNGRAPSQTSTTPVSGGSVTLYDDTGVAVATGDVSGDGTVVFPDLPAGRYLVVQETPAEGFAPFEPFTVEVADNDVEASPKMKPGTEEEPPEPETPPTPPQSDTDLPYTGQITWPIPVLAAAGLALILFGVYLWTRGKRHEA